MHRDTHKQQEAQTKKQWHRPELEEIPVQATAFNQGPGSDGVALALNMSGDGMTVIEL